MATQAQARQPGQQAGTHKAIKTPPFRLATAKDRSNVRYLNLLIYGAYGVGKTYLAASAVDAPELNDVFLISAESGDLTVEMEPRYEHIPSVTVRDFKTFNHIYQFLKEHCKARDDGNTEQLRKLQSAVTGEEAGDIKDPYIFRTVIIDSLSEVENYCMNQLLDQTDTTKLDEETQKAGWDEYGKNNSMMKRLVRHFRDLPMHTIFTCAEHYKQDEIKKYRYYPDLTGKLSKEVQGFMDMVGYYVKGREGENELRKLYVSPSTEGRFDAKHRYSTFKGGHFDNPTIAKILKEVGLLTSPSQK